VLPASTGQPFCLSRSAGADVLPASTGQPFCLSPCAGAGTGECVYLDPEQQPPVRLLQLLPAAVELAGMQLLLLQPLDVLHGRLQDGALVPAHVPVAERGKRKTREKR